MKKMMHMVVLCVVLALSLAISAYAAERSPLSIEAENASAASTELTIQVRLTAPVTDGVFRFHYDAVQLKLLSVASPAPDTAELNGPAGADGLSAGANLPAGQIKAAFVYDETGIADDIVLECRFRITGTARTFTFTADEGDLYRDGQSVPCPAVSKEVRLSNTIIVTPGTPSRPAAPKKDFSDVKRGDWFYDAVMDLVEKGYINGVSDTLFAPNQNLSRGMLVTILYRLDGEKAAAGTSSFRDVVSDSWYAKAVDWAAANGIVYGYQNGNFGPNDLVTRQQLAAILWRYAKYKGLNVSANGTALPDFTDRGQIAAWANEAITWAYSRGIMNGRNNGALDPNGSATRAEAAVMLYRFLQL